MEMSGKRSKTKPGTIGVADRRDPVAMVGNFLEVVRSDRPDAAEEQVLADALLIAETEKD